MSQLISPAHSELKRRERPVGPPNPGPPNPIPKRTPAAGPSLPPTATAITLPLYFISGVFVAVAVLPHWLGDVGEIFPVRHLANALLVAYNPHTRGLGFAGPDLLILAAWGAAGLLIAVRKFSWLPLGR